MKAAVALLVLWPVTLSAQRYPTPGEVKACLGGATPALVRFEQATDRIVFSQLNLPYGLKVKSEQWLDLFRGQVKQAKESVIALKKLQKPSSSPLFEIYVTLARAQSEVSSYVLMLERFGKDDKLKDEFEEAGTELYQAVGTCELVVMRQLAAQDAEVARNRK